MTLRSTVKWTNLVCAAALTVACTSSGPREGLAATDEIEPFNRAMHQTNVTLDRYVLRPAARTYEFVTPTLIQHLIHNGLNHLDLTTDFANYVLQGDVDRSLETLGRFTLNTVLGAGGLLDPATEFGLAKEDTDFGITLGRYGVGEGSYLVLPLLGPSTVRDTFGFVVDRAFYPMTYVGAFTAADGAGPAVSGVELLDRRSRNAEVVDELLYETDDSYVTLRAAYLQRRRAQIAGEEGAVENLPDIFDDEAEEQDGEDAEGEDAEPVEEGTVAE